MTARYRFWVGLFCVVGTFAGVTDVHAQAWLSSPSRAQGAGLRVGELELHPGIGAEVGWENNVYLADTDEVDSAELRISPHLFLTTLVSPARGSEGAAPPPFIFNAGVSGGLRHYFADDTPDTDMSAGQALDLTISPERPVSLMIYEKFSRTVKPFAEPGDPNNLVGADFDRDRITLGTRLKLQTRGGLLQGQAGYELGFDHFEGDDFVGNRSRSHRFTLRSSYEFLPETALFWAGSATLREYTNGTSTSSTALNDGTRVSSVLGLNGALTSTFALTLSVGYGAGFFDQGAEFDSVIGAVEARWRAARAVTWRLGYERDFGFSFQGNYTQLDRFKTQLDLLAGSALVLAAKAELTLADYGRDGALESTFGTPSQADRSDVHLLLALSGEYRFVEWLAATAELSYVQNITDFSYPVVDQAGTVSLDSAEYSAFEAWAGMRAFF